MDSSTELPDFGQKHETSTTDERQDQLQFFVDNGIPSERCDEFFRNLTNSFITCFQIQTLTYIY